MKINSNRDELKKRLTKAFDAVVDAYDDANREVISEKRNWDGNFGTTKRRNGETVVGNYRNIVDIKNLKDSQRVTRTSKMSAEFMWDGNGVTPPTIVHEGATLRNGTRIEGRRWTEKAAEEADLPDVFRRAYREG